MLLAVVLAMLLNVTGVAGCRTPLRESRDGVPQPASLRRAFDRLQGAGGPSGVVLLSTPAQAWVTRWELLRDAQHTVDATYFIVEEDLFGLAFLGHLLVKARAGVRVRLLVDGRGSLPLTTPLLGRDHLVELASSGHADVRIYNPPFNQLIQSILRANAVPISAGTHHKILVVDGSRAVTGGRNIGKVYFSDGAEDPTAVDDADVLVDGPETVARMLDAMDREFPAGSRAGLAPDILHPPPSAALLLMMYAAMEAWLTGTVPVGPAEESTLALEAVALAHLDALPPRDVRAAARASLRALAVRTSLHGAAPYPRAPTGDTRALDPSGERHEGEVRVVTTMSRLVKVDDAANDALVRSIGGARRSIVIESPYFVLTPRLLKALEAAERRGVGITVLTNSPLSSDNPPSQALFIDTWPELMARMPGLRIFVPQDSRMLHAKRAVFDDDLTLIGTYNIDPFSAHVNSEMVLSVWSRSFNAQNRNELEGTIARRGLLEYRIARDSSRGALRHSAGHPQAGKVIVLFGPRDHTPREVIEQLGTMKHVLLGLRSLWDFEVVVW